MQSYIRKQSFIHLPCMSVGVQTTFLFLQKNHLGAWGSVGHTQLSAKGRGRADTGLPSKMVGTKEDFHHRILALEGL
jgi:hypothetical protein